MNNTTVNLNTVPKFENNTVYYNNQKYEFNIIFSNLQGNNVRLNPAGLVSLEIEEDSREWYKRAVLTINNPKNVLEYRPSASTPLNQYYKFRNDGRDLVYIEFKPVNDSLINTPNIDIDYDVWGMKYLFSVYDKKEIQTGDSLLEKQLRLYLWEFEYQVMAEANLDWSTNELLPTNIIPSQATDEQKRVLTGLAMKSLITRALASYSTPKFSQEWDPGSSKIFYTSYANSTAKEDLEYLYKKFVSSQSGTDGGLDPGILSRTRYNQIWMLRSFTNIFSKAISKSGATATAGELQREILTLASQGSNTETNSEALFNLPVSPFTSSKYKNTNYKDPVRSVITNIQFVDMAAYDNMYEMITTPCYGVNTKDKVLSVDFEVNDIENVKKYITNNYTQKFKTFSTPDTLLTLNKAKLNSRAIRNIYSYAPNKIDRLADSRNFLLYGALFLNTSLNFTVPGSPLRQATSFLSVENDSRGNRDEFRNKLLGQWFVYRVIHKFTQGSYTNNITAVRVHANDNIGIKDTVA